MIGALFGVIVAFAPQAKDLDVFAKWRNYLAPKAEECAFEAVGWRGTFWSGVIEAQKARKPILLWAMNGHPLACT